MSSLSKFTEPQVFRRFSPVLPAKMLGRHSTLPDKRGMVLSQQPVECNMPYDWIAIFPHDAASAVSSQIYGLK